MTLQERPFLHPVQAVVHPDDSSPQPPVSASVQHQQRDIEHNYRQVTEYHVTTGRASSDDTHSPLFGQFNQSTNNGIPLSATRGTSAAAVADSQEPTDVELEATECMRSVLELTPPPSSGQQQQHHHHGDRIHEHHHRHNGLFAQFE